MSNKIYPIIFFSISLDGQEMSDSIKKFSSKINQPVYSRFVRFAYFNADNTVTTNINEDKLTLDFNNNGTNKLNNYSVLNQNRTSFLSVFEISKALTNSVFGIFSNRACIN